MKDLDELIDSYKEIPIHGEDKTPPTAYKVCIEIKCISHVLSKLELMNVGGASLYLDADGVARDVVNAYSYNPKTPLLRGIRYEGRADSDV